MLVFNPCGSRTRRLFQMTGKKIAVGICGASGMPYARRLMEVLAESGASVYASASSAAKPIFKSELGIDFQDFANALSQKFPSVKFFDDFDFSAPIASGSFYFDAMAICPCSMKTLSRIATATGDNLICRAADVALKERRKLVLVARETNPSPQHGFRNGGGSRGSPRLPRILF